MAKTKTTEKKGKKAPTKESGEKPEWLKYSDKEIDSIIVKLSKQGLTSEKIGLALRDQYGIPSTKLLGKKVGKVLKENKLFEDATLKNLESKRELIINHLEKNKQDKRAKLALTTISARISKLKKYKARTNKE